MSCVAVMSAVATLTRRFFVNERAGMIRLSITKNQYQFHIYTRSKTKLVFIVVSLSATSVESLSITLKIDGVTSQSTGK